eukprot:SAG31_NODE_4316_length_3363_cov_11.868862_3_plen_153_part_00
MDPSDIFFLKKILLNVVLRGCERVGVVTCMCRGLLVNVVLRRCERVGVVTCMCRGLLVNVVLRRCERVRVVTFTFRGLLVNVVLRRCERVGPLSLRPSRVSRSDPPRCSCGASSAGGHRRVTDDYSSPVRARRFKRLVGRERSARVVHVTGS